MQAELVVNGIAYITNIRNKSHRMSVLNPSDHPLYRGKALKWKEKHALEELSRQKTIDELIHNTNCKNLQGIEQLTYIDIYLHENIQTPGMFKRNISVMLY